MKIVIQQNLLTPPHSLGLCFSECQWKQKIGIGHYEKMENCHTVKFQIIDTYQIKCWQKCKIGIGHYE